MNYFFKREFLEGDFPGFQAPKDPDRKSGLSETPIS